MRLIAAGLLTAVLAVGCTGNEGADNAALVSAEGPAGVAQATVAKYLGVATATVRIVSVEAVEFADSSLGCPQPGMAYLAVLTPGHKVVAEANDQNLDVRVSGNHGLICEPAPKPTPKR